MPKIGIPKTVLITGASSGIGYELAKLFAQNHDNLVLVARSENKLNDIKINFEQNYQVIVTVLPKDLSQPNAAEEIFNQLAAEKIQVDVLINNAGFGDFGEFVNTSWEKEADMMQVNMVALTQITKLFLKGMVERRRGKIVNVASTAAFQPGPLMAVYYATKAYVLFFSEAIANELEGTGVTVTALCPGATESGFQLASGMIESRIVKGRKLPTAEAVAKFAYKAIEKGQVVAIHGLLNWIGANVIRFLPRKVVTDIVRTMQESDR
ncbi:MAG TPA: short-chain dehydrogenase [Cyanobacteria bacterium UBA11149]|nr:short-chain dehydrogenase [Cyanobacteria bacterium UBA11367]HBE57919.1 short-chain dehydrogenase [Cyanobacteria bacterium UBA11366]HBK66465.1 short-chain dehydrogenase [Cyanobacteria bacterium UBA11166]HBR74826.1 short-chain dehydrogenase [Cyanobacteria bacterium UBA11159]HBS69091.1 short-chain dehydrogenase [Cyanobacteria bacterium UBA11153]HBW90934.1 short-chain dehydrogenase [Cyanobacteria bacterium UBA11149]HCA95072.1 short-chain dehydrogenase [Cyanobacteria bacterium UBA9226]